MSKKQWVVIVLSGILLFHFFSNFIWLEKDNFIHGVDANWHIIEAVKYHEACKKIMLLQASFFVKTGQLIQTFRHWMPTPNWPPLVYFLSALISPHEIHPFGLRLYINFIFFGLLILSTYFLGKKCFNRRVGLIAAFLVSFYPAVAAYSRQFGLDFPLLCVTAACVCLLVYSENFSKRGYSLLFGLSLGMGTLVKLQIIIFLSVPLLYAVFGVFRQKKNEKLYGFSNLILSFAISFGLFYLYWGNKINDMLYSVQAHVLLFYPHFADKGLIGSGASLSIFSLRSVTFYLESLFLHASFLPFILFVVALVVFLIRGNKWRTFFLLSFLIPYFILTLISVKWTRYALPLLPFLAVISAWLINGIRSKYIKIPILCLLVIQMMSFYFLNSWTRKRCELVPRSLMSLAAPDRTISNLYPPDSFDYIGEFKKAGIIPYIEQKVREGKILRLEFKGDNVEDPVALLYVYFQGAVLNGKIIVQNTIQKKSSSFQDADFVVIRDADFSDRKDLLKNFKILSRMRGSVFLVRNEKNPFI